MTVEPAPALVLAVEAGSNKTDVAVVDVSGRLLAVHQGGGLAWHETTDIWIERLRPLAQEVWHEATGAPHASELGVNGRVAVMAACVAHVDLPEDERQFAERLRATGWAEEVLVRNDTFAVLRSGATLAGGRPAVAVTCGSGINCVGTRADGQQARFLAFGDISGDWGGGNDLGSAALWAATRAEDGRGAPTELREALLRHLGADSMREVALRRRNGLLDDSTVRRCTPLLFAVAEDGDAVAKAIVHRQATEIVSMARVMLLRLGALEAGAAVVLGGSVLAARSPLLLDAVVAGMAALSPATTVEVPELPPVAGAVLLGLDAMRAPPDAEATFREALAERLMAGATNC